MTADVPFKFKPYKKTHVTYMRPITKDDCLDWLRGNSISVSDADVANGSPKEGDMLAINSNDSSDQWLVAHRYFVENYEGV